jgi:hypothetical protein
MLAACGSGRSVRVWTPRAEMAAPLPQPEVLQVQQHAAAAAAEAAAATAAEGLVFQLEQWMARVGGVGPDQCGVGCSTLQGKSSTTQRSQTRSLNLVNTSASWFGVVGSPSTAIVTWGTPSHIHLPQPSVPVLLVHPQVHMQGVQEELEQHMEQSRALVARVDQMTQGLQTGAPTGPAAAGEGSCLLQHCTQQYLLCPVTYNEPQCFRICRHQSLL